MFEPRQKKKRKQVAKMVEHIFIKKLMEQENLTHTEVSLMLGLSKTGLTGKFEKVRPAYEMAAELILLKKEREKKIDILIGVVQGSEQMIDALTPWVNQNGGSIKKHKIGAGL